MVAKTVSPEDLETGGFTLFERIDGRGYFTFIWRSNPHETIIRRLIYERSSFIGYYTVKYRDEMLFPRLKLPSILEEQTTADVLHRTIERDAII